MLSRLEQGRDGSEGLLTVAQYSQVSLDVLVDFGRVNIEVDDLASLALHYSYNIVINALSVVYREYFMFEKQINNLAGLVSTIIRSQFNNSKKAA